MFALVFVITQKFGIFSNQNEQMFGKLLLSKSVVHATYLKHCSRYLVNGSTPLQLFSDCQISYEYSHINKNNYHICDAI